MAAYIMNEFKYRAQIGAIDWDTDVFYWILTDGLVPNIDTHLTLADISGSEVAGTGYSRQTVTSLVVTKDLTNDYTHVDADDPLWTSSTITADCLWLMHQAGGIPASTDYICFAFSFTQASSVSGNFTYVLPTGNFYRR